MPVDTQPLMHSGLLRPHFLILLILQDLLLFHRFLVHSFPASRVLSLEHIYFWLPFHYWTVFPGVQLPELKFLHLKYWNNSIFPGNYTFPQFPHLFLDVLTFYPFSLVPLLPVHTTSEADFSAISRSLVFLPFPKPSWNPSSYSPVISPPISSATTKAISDPRSSESSPAEVHSLSPNLLVSVSTYTFHLPPFTI